MFGCDAHGYITCQHSVFTIRLQYSSSGVQYSSAVHNTKDQEGPRRLLAGFSPRCCTVCTTRMLAPLSAVYHIDGNMETAIVRTAVLLLYYCCPTGVLLVYYWCIRRTR